MRAKFVNEMSIKHLPGRSKEELLKLCTGRPDAIFKRSKRDARTTSLAGEIDTSYKTLVKLFGKPGTGDGYKTSTKWVVEDDLGNVATIYDWKETDLYYSGGDSVAKFRKWPSYSWHIGTKRGGYFGFPAFDPIRDTIVEDLRTFIYLNS